MRISAAIKKIFNWIFYFLINHSNSETMKCKRCKGTMSSKHQYLALLPVSFDEKHEESADYYQNCTIPLESEDQIPTGRRACYMHIFQCENCTNRLVSVVDFLKVRDQYLTKGGDIYPYEDFRMYIEKRSRLTTLS